jgi:hypothetical protein
MIKDEALKLAFQTLELSKETMESACKQIDELKAENKALKEALAQAEPFGYFKAEPFGWTACAETDEGAIALYQAPPQRTEQEPVAWLLTGNAPLFDGEIIVYMSKPKWIPEWWRAEPLYTYPPQRTWVELTNGEIEGIKLKACGNVFSAIMFTNDKLKELNT